MQKEYHRKYRVFAPENNHFFLEFLHAEGVSDGTKDGNALLWFGDLLRYELFGHRPINGSEEEVRRKQNYLRSWGYGEEGGNEGSCPFLTGVPGLLTATWSQGHYLDYAQKFADGILFLVEPLYVGVTFGLAALDLFTTTGARHNEVLQISLDPACLYTVEIEGTLHYLMRLIPKNADKPADYIVSAETRNNLEKIGDLLQEHYQLQSGESIPSVPFNPKHSRAHRFKQERPYLFQYGGNIFPSLL